MKRLCFVGLGVCAVSVAFGQSIITSGSSSFGFTSPTDQFISGSTVRTGFAGGADAQFMPSGAANDLFQTWWWYRVNSGNPGGSPFSDTRENAFSRLISKNVAGNTMTLNYTETTDGTANGRTLFDSAIRYTITNQASGTLVTSDNFITNTSGAALTISIFGYVDYDIPGSSGTNTAALLGNLDSGTIRVNGTQGQADYRFLNASSIQASGFSTVRTLLTNNTIDNLNGSGFPFTGDFTAAVQWDITLQARESISILTSYQAVPEPATMAALGFGALALIRRRRKA